MIEAGIDALEMQHGVDHEPGADQEDHGEGDFGDGQGIASHGAGGAGVLALALAQDHVQIGTRGLDGRGETDQNRGGERNSQSEEQHSAVEANFAGVWKIAGEREQELNATVGKRDAENAAHQRKNSAFRQQLRNQAGAACAEGDAQGVFLASRFGAELEQIRDVHAGDQQDEADGAEQRVQKLPGAAEEILMKREDFDADAFVAGGILLLQACGDRDPFPFGLAARVTPFFRRPTGISQ